MPVGILIVTHGEIGEELLSTAQSTLGGSLPLKCKALSVSPSCDPEQQNNKAQKLLTSIDDGDGILVLTDMYGSTPSNIANSLKQREDIEIIAGVNLPMFIRVLNYSDLNLIELKEKAISGGHDGIICCTEGKKIHD